MSKSKRSNYLIDKSFQLGFIFKYVFIILITVILTFSLFIIGLIAYEKINKLNTVITITKSNDLVPVIFDGYQVFNYDKEKIQVYLNKDNKYICYKAAVDSKYKINDAVEDVDQSLLIKAMEVKKRVINRFDIIFLPLLFVTIILLIIITIFSLFFSHKMAGPIYRINVSLDKLLKGEKDFTIKVRKTDFFTEIADKLELLRQKMIKK